MLPNESASHLTGRFDEFTYQSHLRPIPYVRNEHWLSFFGHIADELSKQFAPKRVFDAGCGLGILVESFRDRGIEAYGRDPSALGITHVRADIRPYCEEGSIAGPITGAFDLVTSIDVLEYMPETEALQAIKMMAAVTDTIVFSSATNETHETIPPNPHPTIYWLQRFAEVGFFPLSTYAPDFITPHAFVLERRSQHASDEELTTFAEVIRLRVALAQSSVLVDEAREDLTYLQQMLVHSKTDQKKSTNQLPRLSSEQPRSPQSDGHAPNAATATSINLPPKALRKIHSLLTLRRFKEHRQSEFLRKSRQTLLSSPLFDGDWYMRQYPDIVSNPVEHYILYGAIEGRDPSPYFSTLTYLKANPSIQPKEMNPLVHYLLHNPKAHLALLDPSTEGKTITTILHERFRSSTPLQLFNVPKTARAINVVMENITISMEYGDAEIALVFATKLAQQLNLPLRIITRTAPPVAENFYRLLKIHGISWNGNVEFVFSGPSLGLPSVGVSFGDIFITTSWSTTWSTRASTQSKNILYFIQEDERMRYASGDDQVRCAEILADPDLIFVVHSQALYNHLCAEGFDNIRQNGVWFEPAFSEKLYGYDTSRRGDKQNFYFHARPSNSQHLYYRGLEAISAAIEQGTLDPERWNIHFVGDELGEIILPRKTRPHISGGLTREAYIALVRTMDVGLALMHTPRSNYPMLDLAACGAIAVTNRTRGEVALDHFSRNIICTDVNVPSLTQGIAGAIALSTDLTLRQAHYQSNAITRTWEAAFQGVFDRILPLLRKEEAYHNAQ